MSFLEIADLRNITTANAQLAELDWDVEPDGYQRQRLPPSGVPVAGVLRLMARRGLEPALVRALLASYPARPVERALIAYDALGGPLLGDDDGALADQLREELVPIKAFATPLAAVPAAAVGQLLEAMRGAALAGSDDDPLPSLAAARDGLADDAARDGLFAHIRTLARARLGSLALAHLQIVTKRYAVPEARDLLVEIALDHDALGAVPPPAERSPREARLQAYIVVRASLLQYDLGAAERFLVELGQHPEIADPADDRFPLLRAQLAVMRGALPDAETASRVRAIGNADLMWRFAQAVTTGLAIADSPEYTPQSVESYLTTFGNDSRVWGQALLREDPAVRSELAKLLARELRYGSHDPEAWRALSMFGDNPAISDEVDERLKAQIEAVLA